MLGLIPFSGEVVIDGVSIAGLSPAEMRPVRRKAQMIFQDPYASLDPRMSVGAAIGEPLTIHGIGTASERRGELIFAKRHQYAPRHSTKVEGTSAR